MINQKINALKLATSLIDLSRDDDDSPRMSLLDMQIFLTINASPTSGKNDILQIINGSTTSKSFIDRPIKRLLKYQLIDKTHNDHAITKEGEARVSYTVSKQGQQLIRACAILKMNNTLNTDTMAGILLLIIGGLIYFIPAMIASGRNHPAITGITLLNLFLGWTVIIWIVCFIWAYSSPNIQTEKTATHKKTSPPYFLIAIIICIGIAAFIASKPAKKETYEPKVTDLNAEKYLEELPIEIYYEQANTKIALLSGKTPSYKDTMIFGFNTCKPESICLIWFFNDKNKADQAKTLLKTYSGLSKITGVYGIYSKNRGVNKVTCYKHKGTC